MRIKLQPDDFSCGIYSIMNALSAYGEARPRKEIKSLTETTEAGTDEKGLQNCLSELGYQYRVYITKDARGAWRWCLRNAINKPLILYITGDHWVAVCGRVRDRIIVIDSLTSCHIMGRKELLEKWKVRGQYWGMSISK